MELNTILNIMIQYNLTADELMLVYLTFLAQEEENHAEYFAKWFSNGGKSRLKDLFESLKDKGIIKKNYNPESYVPDEIEFNKNFLKGWIKNSGELGQELFDEYEKFAYINGNYVPLRSVGKFNTLEDLYFHYSVTIKHSIEKHKEVMSILKQAKERKLVNVSLVNFICSKKWEDYKYMIDNNIGCDSVSTYDVIDSL